MSKILLFNKPYGVLSQFTDAPTGQSSRQRSGGSARGTLAHYIPFKDVYPAGRLDLDSEGLLVLTDSGRLQQGLCDPRYKLPKTYWVQVEGLPGPEALERLATGVPLRDGLTAPTRAVLIEEPPLWPRVPPIRYRARIATAWLALTLIEGRNRQVRRMTAAVGHPTLRLVRYAVGPWSLEGLAPRQWRELGADDPTVIELVHDLDTACHRGRHLRTGRPLSGRGRRVGR